MFCKYCGVQISEDTQFCSACGKKTENFEANQPQEQTQTKTYETDYSYVAGANEPNQQNNGYNQYNQPYEPPVSIEVEELKDKIFIYGLLSSIFSVIGFSIVGIILGAISGKKVKKLKAMNYYPKGKTKAGDILGKIGLILGIVATSCIALFLIVWAISMVVVVSSGSAGLLL